MSTVCENKRLLDFKDWRYGCLQHCQKVGHCVRFAEGKKLHEQRLCEFDKLVEEMGKTFYSIN